MKNTLLINQYVRKFLVDDTNISGKIGDRVYPLDALQGTALPFIVITRQSTTFDNSKDGYYQEDVPVEVTIVANTYNESVELANYTRSTLEHKSYNSTDISEEGYDPINIVDSKLISCYESLYNNAYIQQLTFNFEVQ